jgi:hypothetical protein
MPIQFHGFPSIEGFHNVVKAVGAYPHLAPGPVKYRGKIKLHGTNAGVRIAEGDCAAQSRTQIVTVGNDNAGFAAWVLTKLEFFRTLASHYKDCTIFGEWCGPGIMKGTAINLIPAKVFAIFAITEGETPDSATMMTDPAKIDQTLSVAGDLPEGVHILPWYGDEFTIDLKDRDSLPPVVDKLNKVVAEVEPGDPWVKQVFGIDGTAEGVVYYPGAGEKITRKMFSDLAFKAKGEKHKAVKTKESVQIDPEVAKSVEEFVRLFATEARFEQGLAVVGSADFKNVPLFLKWVGIDVHKESADELEASGLEWSQVEKSVQAAARNWFILKCKSI